MTKTRCLLTASTALVAAGLLAAPALAQTAAPAAPVAWVDGIKFGAQIEAGVSFNPSSPSPSTNFGQLFTDHPNQVQLNQILLSVERDIPKDATGWDVGFKLQGMYGSDARYTHFLGIFDYALSGRYQLDIVEASLSVHAPVLNGLDVKAGLYPTPLGFEVIDPSANPFYSHSYIFNYGIPLKHAGVLAVLHANDMIDLYGGIDTGVNTTFGDQAGDNNGAIAGLVGLGITGLSGNLTGVSLLHFGPETPSWSPTQSWGFAGANQYYRYESDTYVTYKWNSKLTTTTEFNFIKDENPFYYAPSAWGLAQYVSYALNDTVTLNARAEFFRDTTGFFVGYFPGNLDFVNAQYGKPNTSFVYYPTGHNYGEITLGLTWKPDGLPKQIAGLLIRPEIRYDANVGGPPAFNGGTSASAFTFASDIILQF